MSKEEILRRHKAIRLRMEQENLSVLVVVSSSEVNLRGSVRYLSNWPTPGNSSYCIFPLDNDPTLLVSFQGDVHEAEERTLIKDIRYTSDICGDIFQLINSSNFKGEIGLVGLNAMRTTDYLELMKRLEPKFKVKHTPNLLNNLRILKSSEEVEYSRNAATLAYKGFEYFHEIWKPRIRENKLILELHNFLKNGGAEEVYTYFECGSRVIYPHHYPRNCKLEKCKMFTLSIELCNYEGYWTQIVRTNSTEKSFLELEDAKKECYSIEEKMTENLIPNKKISNVFKEATMNLEGRYCFGIGLGHGQGLDMVEKPLLNSEEETLVKPGMIVTVHPHIIDRKNNLGCWQGKMYLIKDQGAENIIPEKSKLEI